MMWLKLRRGRFELRVHAATPLCALALVAPGGDLWLRYLLLLASLLLHELTHAAACLGLGGRAAVVSIWPFFGRANVETFPDRREAVVALAAPLANLAAAGVLLAAGAVPTIALTRAPVRDFLFTVNLAMGVVNLLPVPPIDGGRALQALFRRSPGASAN